MLIADVMPGVIDDLKRLVGHASVAFPGYPAEPMRDIAEELLRLFGEAGVGDLRPIDVGGTYPSLYGEIPAPPGMPTVLLYAHYDVQPAPRSQGWSTDPWQATTGDDGRIYGRGAADDKSGVVAHLGTLRAFGGHPPVGIKLLLEGEEETASHIQKFVRANPEMFACDAFIIADSGNIRCGAPVLTTSLRGGVFFTLTLSTLGDPVHSGLFGGAAPDALMTLIRLLSTLHTAAGDVAVQGLHQFDWSGGDFPEPDFRAASGILDGVALTGTGSIASRIWSRPSITVLGLDAPPTKGAVAALIPRVSATISMRIPPGADPEREYRVLREHLETHTPGNARLEFGTPSLSAPFAMDPGGTFITAAKEAMAQAYGRPVEEIGCGGSIPLCAAFQAIAPGADIILWGAEDAARARIHSSQESVDPEEIGRLVTSQVLFLQKLAGG